MRGGTLAELELAFGTAPDRLGYCEMAREFVLRIVPDLAHIFGLLPQLYSVLFVFEMDTPVALATLGWAIREGYDSTEKLALRQIRRRRLNRVAVHNQFAELSRLVHTPAVGETFADVLSRVQEAVDLQELLS